MLLVRWAPIVETEIVPPFGDALNDHIISRRNLRVRHASCSAWGLLYQILLENNLPPAEVRFLEIGKPCFADSSLFFSLSHSKGLCAAAVSDMPVGADLELCRAEYNSRLMDRSMSEAERASFDGDFTRLWCRKESAAKLTGEGITAYPKTIDTGAYRFTERLIEYAGGKYWLVAAQDPASYEAP